jgi:hypothetical protein
MSQRARHKRAVSKQRSKWRWVGIVVGGSLGIVLALALVGVFFALRVPPPPIVWIDPTAAERFEQELNEAQSTASRGKPKVVQADETEINSMLVRQFKEKMTGPEKATAAAIRDMKITLKEDRLHLYVVAKVRGREVVFQLEGRLGARDGYLNFDPTLGKIGLLPLPKASIKNAIDKVLSAPETRGSLRLPGNVQDLHVEDGKLVIVFK